METTSQLQLVWTRWLFLQSCSSPGQGPQKIFDLKIDIPTFCLSAANHSLSFWGSTFWQADTPINWHNKFPADVPHQQKKRNTQYRSSPLSWAQHAERREVLKLLTSPALKVFCATAVMREEDAEEGEGLQLALWSTFVHQIYGALHTSHAQNAESVIYPGAPKRREMFICYHYFSSMVIRELELMSRLHYLSLCRATRWH